MRNKLAAVERVQPFLHFPLEPLVVLHLARNQFLHDLVGSLPRVGSDLGQPGLNLRR